MTDVGPGIYEDEDIFGVCSETFAALYRLWKQKLRGRSMPARGDLDPVELKPWLGRITLLDVLPGPPLDFRYRLCGSRTTEEYGIDLTGRRLSEVTFVGNPQQVVAHLTDFVTRGRVRYRNDPMQDRHGFASMRERLYLPLSDDGLTINVILIYQESKILVYPQDRR